MEKINLEEFVNDMPLAVAPHKGKIKSAMKKFATKLLELAAENAIIINDPNSYCGNTGSEYFPDQIVSKQSILKTINQIYELPISKSMCGCCGKLVNDDLERCPHCLSPYRI